MSDYDFFSGLDVSDMVLLETSFHVASDLKAGSRELGIAIGHDVHATDEDPEHVQLLLKVGVNDDPEQFATRGFSFSATVSGVFSTEGMAEDEGRRLFVLVNGLSLLYAEVRSYLSQFSSNSPLGRLILPSVNMLTYVKSASEATKSSESQSDEEPTTANSAGT